MLRMWKDKTNAPDTRLEDVRRLLFNRARSLCMAHRLSFWVCTFVAITALGLCTAVQAASVNTTWIASTAPGVTYNMYRSGTLLGQYSKINTVPITGLSFLDTAPLNGTNFYKATAVNSQEQESTSFSNIANATVVVTPPIPPIPTPQTSVLINSGGIAYTSPTGEMWSGDKNFTGGDVFSVTHAIAGTPDQELYKSERWGQFSYSILAPAGSYAVTLKFAETSYNVAKARVFNVAINGTTVLTNFDPYVAAGGQYVAVDRTFNVNSTGAITINFTKGSADFPNVTAIKIVPVLIPPSLPVMTINCLAASVGVSNLPSGAYSMSVTSGTKSASCTGTAP